EANALALSERFAEAVAYLRTFENFDNDRHAVAAYLALPMATLRTRLRRAEIAAQTQRSMFDGIEKIASDFMPKRGHWLRRPTLRRGRLSCLLERTIQLRLLSSLPALFSK